MNKLFCITLFLFSAYCHADYYGKVTYVLDGDTVSITKPNNTKWRVRLSFIDAPEVANNAKNSPTQPYGQQSKQYLMSMVLNKTVLVKEHGTDNNGRFLGELYLNKLNVNKKGIYNQETNKKAKKAYVPVDVDLPMSSVCCSSGFSISFARSTRKISVLSCPVAAAIWSMRSCSFLTAASEGLDFARRSVR